MIDSTVSARGRLLLYIQAGAIPRLPDGALGVPNKTAIGLRAFANRWQGPVAITSLEPPREISEATPGNEWVTPAADRGFAAIATISAADINALRPALVHGSVNTPGIDDVLALGIPVVLGDDYSPSVRRHISMLGATNIADRARIALGAERARRRFDRMVRGAAGFHANGYASYEHYRRVHPSALVYFDHRITRADLDSARPRSVPDSRPLHLAFSGRLIPMKGVQYLPLLAEELHRRSLDVKISVAGTGPLSESLKASDHLSLLGHLDFDTEWKNFATSVDVMLFPHVQGDSSSTYYEAMGMGVPVLGFANDTLSPLLRHGGGGWEVRQGDIRAMADLIEAISRDENLLRDQSSQALQYMAPLSMESIFDERVRDFIEKAAQKAHGSAR
ncbi:glycosyltransferase [Microbacterium sp. USTB-Y]|uniref:glycosyltransferase n=1 Tax=Microbacterium sp. USTB-Y TaxID=2823692 RepID=UPI00203EBC32|nr:glycosyltransferase [Microbacterium sp. USTB-Y]